MRDQHKCLHTNYRSGFVVAIWGQTNHREVTFTLSCEDCGKECLFQGLGPEATIPFTMGDEIKKAGPVQ